VDECAAEWKEYCDGVIATIESSLARGARVLVVSEPYISTVHVAQQQSLAAAIRRRFGNDHRVTHLDLGVFVDQRDPRLAENGWELTAAGIEVFADGLVDELYAMVKRS
jgi:hypothetical protein